MNDVGRPQSLTDDDVRLIRALAAEYERHAKAAAAARKEAKELQQTARALRRDYERHYAESQKLTVGEIARKFDASHGYISKIIHHRARKGV